VVAEARATDVAMRPERRRQLSGLLYTVDLIRNDTVSLHATRSDDGIPPHMDSIMSDTADLLHTLRRSILLPREAIIRQHSLPTVDPVLTRLEAAADRLPSTEMATRLKHLVESAKSFLAIANGAQHTLPIGGDSRRSRTSWSQLLRALRGDSSAARHALRMMGTLAAAELFSHLAHVPRGYWIAVTAVVVLKSDFFSTMGRGLSRVAGTLIGVVLATGLVLASGSANLLGLLAVPLLGFFMYSVLNFNYSLYSALISAEIVILLSFFEKVPPTTAMHERIVATLIGSALAMAAYAVFPTWQRSTLPSQLSRLVRAERTYLKAIVTGDRAVLARQETRLWRSQTAAAVDSALKEPGFDRQSRTRTVHLVAALDDFTTALMGLEWRFETDQSPSDAAFLLCCQDLAEALTVIEHCLTNPRGKPVTLVFQHRTDAILSPDLRQTAETLEQACRSMIDWDLWAGTSPNPTTV